MFPSQRTQGGSPLQILARMGHRETTWTSHPSSMWILRLASCHLVHRHEQSLYIISDAFDKVKGMLASQIISGTCIISARTMIYISSTSDYRNVQVVNDLFLEDRGVFFSLCDAYSLEILSMIRGIIATNALPLGDDLKEGAVYRVISRINHNCAPNAVHPWNSTTPKGYVYAMIEDIPARSQILRSYIPNVMEAIRQTKDTQPELPFRMPMLSKSQGRVRWGGWSSQRVHLIHRWESEEGTWRRSRSPDSTEKDWRAVQDDVLVRCIPNLCRLHQLRPRQVIDPEYRAKVEQAGSQCE
ncbi:MAG: hypothetical protein J3Q66DRAFT_139694 [Benniella sp.]|nr:MAG: hypothetical protein J3Q66DRAFT_139694 [Benniella sp.]